MHETLYNNLVGVIIYRYIFEVIFTVILFDVLGVEKGYAFVPYYNIYRLYEGYKGRVWLKNWGKVFITAFVTLMSTSLLLTIFSGGLFLFILIGIMALLSPIFMIIVLIFNGLFLVTYYLPILENKFFKALLVINLFSPLLIFLPYPDPINTTYTPLLIYSVVNIVFMVVCIGSANNIRKKVKNGQYVLYEKLDYEKLTYDEIRAELKSRGRMLAHPADDEKDYYSQFNQEIEDKKEDIE